MLTLTFGLAMVACNGSSPSEPKRADASASGGAGGGAGSGGASGQDAIAPDAQSAPDAKPADVVASTGGASGGTTGTGGLGTGGTSSPSTGGSTGQDAGATGTGGGSGGTSRDASAAGTGGTAGSTTQDAGAASTGGSTGRDAGAASTGGSAGRDAGTAGTGGTSDAGAPPDGNLTDAGTAVPCQEPATIFPLPASFGVPHATKALLACGVYVIGAAVVADAALLRAQQILQVELRKVSDDIPGVAAKLTTSKSRIVILGKNEDQSIYWPSASGRRSFCSWPDQNGMIEYTTLEEELTSSQRSLLMTTVHETGHFTQFVLYLYNKPLYDRSVTAFNNCTKSLYNDYDLQNAQEFFAGDTLRWYDLNPSDLAVSDANTLSQRDQLKKYSATMYQIMSEVFYPAAIP